MPEYKFSLTIEVGQDKASDTYELGSSSPNKEQLMGYLSSAVVVLLDQLEAAAAGKPGQPK